MAATMDINAALDSQIRAVEDEKKAIERDARDRIRALDKQAVQIKKAKELLSVNGTSVGKVSRSTSVDPARRAGPKAIGLVSDYLQKAENKTAFQSQMVKDLPLQASVVSYAVAALRNREQIEATGRSNRASKEYRWVGDEKKK